MNIATILFTYNRSYHTKKVLEALAENTVLPEKLYIFQDGLKEEKDYEEWNKVNEYIRQVDFCPVELIESKTNKGLAGSIVSGLNCVFEKHDAVIVLEDDCVPAPDFINFMYQCFETYKENKKVYSISGYAWPIDVKQQDENDIYFCGRTSSWGWGTWKDRWNKYEQDYTFLRRMKSCPEGSKNLALWGDDLEQTLVGRVKGENDSWGVFWALKTIEDGGVCVNPYISLIHNIGFDGSGVHCSKTNNYDVEMNLSKGRKFVLPEKVVILEETKMAFAELHGNYTAANEREAEVGKRILVYGLGNRFHQKEGEINSKYQILGFIDNNKKGYYAGKRIIKSNDISGYAYDKIIVTIQNIGECIKVVKSLVREQKIPYDSIQIDNSTEFEELRVAEDGDLIIVWENIQIKISSLAEYYNVREVFLNKNYCYAINPLLHEKKRRDIVIDIGMNIGDSVLYFLTDPKVEKIFAFEPFRETFLKAEENMRQNQIDRKRVELLSYGISDRTEERIIDYNDAMSPGQSTLRDFRETAYDMYDRLKLVDLRDEQSEHVQVRKASEVIGKIIEENENCNIVLKMDCEGEEYGVIKNLAEENLLEKVDFIMLEWHYRGKDSLIEHLQEKGFSYWCGDRDKDMGYIYAYNMRTRIE